MTRPKFRKPALAVLADATIANATAPNINFFMDLTPFEPPYPARQQLRNTQTPIRRLDVGKLFFIHPQSFFLEFFAVRKAQ
jgi:hypothetical protein